MKMGWFAPLVMTALAVILILVGCTSSQIVNTLEDVVTAAEVAVPVIGGASGVPASTISQIVTYLQAVSMATSQAATILSGAGSSAEKSAQIIAAFAGVASGLNLPAGTAGDVVAVVSAVSQAVVRFLSNFPTSPAAPVPTIKISAADQITLSNLKLRSDADLSKLRGMKR